MLLDHHNEHIVYFTLHLASQDTLFFVVQRVTGEGQKAFRVKEKNVILILGVGSISGFSTVTVSF